MTHAAHCRECEEYAWPPVEAGGPGGQTEIAACRLALQRVRESGHTDVDVVAGCYYVGNGPIPTGFDGTETNPDAVCVPKRSNLVDTTATAARVLRDVADDLADGQRRDFLERHLWGMASSVDAESE